MTIKVPIEGLLINLPLIFFGAFFALLEDIINLSANQL